MIYELKVFCLKEKINILFCLKNYFDSESYKCFSTQTVLLQRVLYFVCILLSCIVSDVNIVPMILYYLKNFPIQYFILFLDLSSAAELPRKSLMIVSRRTLARTVQNQAIFQRSEFMMLKGPKLSQFPTSCLRDCLSCQQILMQIQRERRSQDLGNREQLFECI